MIRIVKAAVAWLTSDKDDADAKAPPKETEDAEAKEAPQAPASPYAAANDRIRETAKWMAAALAAVATVLVGTSPLSGIGRLSPDDPGRFWLALAAIATGLAASLVAIFLLSRIQLPQTVLAADIIEIAKDPRSAVAREAEHEPFLTAGRSSLAAMLDDYAKVQAAYYAAVADLTAAEAEALGISSDGTRDAAGGAGPASAGRADAAASRGPAVPHRAATPRRPADDADAIDTAKKRVAFEEGRDARLSPSVRYATDLAIHQKLRNQTGAYLPWIVTLSVLAGMAFVVFAWAANPPEDGAGDVLAARPSAGVLTGDDDDREALERQVGAECAARIVEGDGAAVLALAAADGTLEVVIVPDDVCADAVRLTVPADRVTPTGRVG